MYNQVIVRQAVVLDDGNERVAFVTIDVIGSDGTLAKIGNAMR